MKRFFIAIRPGGPYTYCKVLVLMIWDMRRYNDGRLQQAFALPTVLIASVVMMIVLLVSVQGLVSVDQSLLQTHQERLAREAAEAGLRHARECIENGAGVWTTGSPLRPQSPASCDGLANMTGCATDPDCYVLYPLSDSKERTRYEVTGSLDGMTYTVQSTGIYELYRSSGTTVAKSSTSNIKMRIDVQKMVASKSASGPLYVCAIINQEGWCWGNHKEGQLGIGGNISTEPSYHQDGEGNPIRVKVARDSLPGYDKDIDIAASNGTACMITTKANANPQTEWEDRRITCWGREEYGKMGNSLPPTTTTDATQWYPSPTRFVGFTGGTPYGGTWTAHSTRSWQNNSTDPAQKQYPAQIVAGSNFFCALTATKTGGMTNNVYCWGRNNKGQIGYGTVSNSATTGGLPYKVSQPGGGSGGGNATAGGINAKYIHTSASARHVCAIRADDIVFCWGDNEFGQIGSGSVDATVNSPTAVRIDTPGYPQLEVEPDGGVAAGGHLAGNSDDGDDDASGKSTTGVSCGIQKGTRKIYCWGSNANGERGTSDTMSATSTQIRAKRIPSVYRYEGGGWYPRDYRAYKIAISYQAVCAIISIPPVSKRTVACWGDNQRGELGIMPNVLTPSRINEPVVLPSFYNGDIAGEPVDIQGGAYRMCAIIGSSNYCWGRDHTAQVGDGIVRANGCRGTPVAPWSTYICSTTDRKDSEWIPTKSAFSDPLSPAVYY